MVLDDVTTYEHTRAQTREVVDRWLNRPLDPVAAQEYDREHFGVDDRAAAEAARKDELWAEATLE